MLDYASNISIDSSTAHRWTETPAGSTTSADLSDTEVTFTMYRSQRLAIPVVF
jgi:hypothetical protein